MERELVEILKEAGLCARRVPLSGSMKASGFGGDLLVADPCENCGSSKGIEETGRADMPRVCAGCKAPMAGLLESEERWETKGRGQGFKKIYAWLQDAAVLAFRGDREEWIVTMRLEDYIKDRKGASQ